MPLRCSPGGGALNAATRSRRVGDGWPGPHIRAMRPNRPVYLDNQATTPCDPRVVAAMLPWFTERFGNPHSAEHAMGQEAAAAVEAARAEVAALIGAEAREVVLTSGATEANNIAIKGAARYALSQEDPRRRVVTVATEHKCVLESVRGPGGRGVRAGGAARPGRRAAGPGRVAGGLAGADAAGQRNGGEQRDRGGAGHRRPGRASPARPARCSIPMPPRPRARCRWMCTSRASTC